MFAGRYLWWVLIAIGIFVFAALGLDHITWLAVQLSGCANMVGGCEPAVRLIPAALKTACPWIAIGVLFVVTLARLHYLSLLWFWGPLVTVWFVTSTPILLFLAADAAAIRLTAILPALPVALLFLMAFVAYLMVHVEEGDTRPLAASAIRLTAIYGALAAIAFTPELSRTAGALLDMPALSVVVALAQPYLQTLLTAGTGSMAPVYAVLALFIAALGASLLPQAAKRSPARRTVMLRRLRR
jgi:hypothetical protein